MYTFPFFFQLHFKFILFGEIITKTICKSAKINEQLFNHHCRPKLIPQSCKSNSNWSSFTNFPWYFLFFWTNFWLFWKIRKKNSFLEVVCNERECLNLPTRTGFENLFRTPQIPTYTVWSWGSLQWTKESCQVPALILVLLKVILT